MSIYHRWYKTKLCQSTLNSNLPWGEGVKHSPCFWKCHSGESSTKAIAFLRAMCQAFLDCLSGLSRRTHLTKQLKPVQMMMIMMMIMIMMMMISGCVNGEGKVVFRRSRWSATCCNSFDSPITQKQAHTVATERDGLDSVYDVPKSNAHYPNSCLGKIKLNTLGFPTKANIAGWFREDGFRGQDL